jgi:hypothetical protein
VPKTIYDIEIFPLRDLKDHVAIFLKDKLLFIPFTIFFKKCDIPFYDEKL